MNGEIVKSSCVLLEKCFNGGFKTFVQVKDEDLKELINKTLWTFAQKSFIPHGSDTDPLPEKQPIYISTKDSCPIDAKLLMLVGRYRIDVAEYERVIVMVDGNDNEEVKAAHDMLESAKPLGHTVEYYRQTPKGWETA